jgi:hypothetical protein
MIYKVHSSGTTPVIKVITDDFDQVKQAVHSGKCWSLNLSYSFRFWRFMYVYEFNPKML